MSRLPSVHDDLLKLRITLFMELPNRDAYVNRSGFIASITSSDPLNYHVPPTWPGYEVEGRGRHPACGLYALYIILRAHPKLVQKNVLPRPPTHEMCTSADPISLMEIAQALGLTESGPLYSVFHLEKLCDALNIVSFSYLLPDDDLQELSNETLKSCYLRKIQDLLSAGNWLIAAADVSIRAGYGTHWIVLFGWFFDQSKMLYVLGADAGRYYCLSGEELFQANKNLPVKNPLYAETEYAETESERSLTSRSCGQVKAVEGDDDLSTFRFGLLSIPGTLFKSDESLRRKKWQQEQSPAKRRP